MIKYKIWALVCLLIVVFTSYYLYHTSTPEPAKPGYVKVDHGELFYQTFGEGEPVIVLHGGPGLDQGYLLPQMLELAKDHQLIFYDQRGSGRSLGSPLNAKYINMNKFVEDLDRLRNSLGLEKVVLLGHSWGARLAVNYVIKHQDHVSKLVLLSPSPMHAEGFAAFSKELNNRLLPIKDKTAAVFSYKDFKKLDANGIQQLYRDFFGVWFDDQSKNKDLSLNINVESARSGFMVLEQMFANSPQPAAASISPILAKITVPTLIIHGYQDAVPPSTAQDLKDMMPSASIVYLNHCGHFSYIEKPQETFSAIRAFLERH
ncbi:MAG: alpha/beta fold hydrolase [Proteobacteria bacterium]|nr:alpha/beta fold hydrolase [Pseudomonadota bacterium]